MALDGILLSKIIPEIRSALPMRIQKIWDISSTEILFQTHGPLGKKQMLISCHSVYNRFLFTAKDYPTRSEPGNFVMLLRKYLEGGFIETIEQADLDRWCVMNIRRRNAIGDLENHKLYVELMGKYANIILVSEEGKIIDALKRIPPFENSRRTIFPGAVFAETPSQNKKNPFTDQTVDPDISLTKQFAGFSPFLSKEIEFRMSHGEAFADIMQEIQDSKNLYVAASEGEPVFHCIEIKSKGLNRSYPLFEGFDILYYRREEKDRIKAISGDIFHFVQRQLKHHTQKLPRLLSEMDEALDCDRWKTYGELLYAYDITDTKGMTSISLQSFEDDSEVLIPLDPKLDGKGNARKSYQKYTKLKKGQKYLEEQIRITEDEIAYFSGLLEQLSQADFTTAAEIQQELVRLGYLKDTSKKKKAKKKKEEKAAVREAVLPSGTRLYFGRNNLQNDTLTWHMARRNDTWLHAKDYHGSHVVLETDSPSEEDLRTAAKVAAYYSAGRMSSSVPVIWCPVKNLKKIPGAKPGMVQLTNYRTIYIDPDEDLIYSLGLD